MPPEMWEKIVSNGTIGGVLILMAWQLPTLIKLFLEHRKEVAVEMNGQSQAHAVTVDKILAANKEQSDKQFIANKEQTDRLVEKFDRRFENVEESIKKLATAQVANQEIIKDTLELLKGKYNGQRAVPS